MMEKIALFDSSYVTDNLGDQIIMNAVHKHLREVFPLGFFTGVPTHDYPGPLAFNYLKDSDFAFVGGTNMLSSHWLWYHQWKLRLKDLGRAGNPVLMGVGWHKYQDKPDIVTQKIYKKVLHKTYNHSVRDKYTFEKLKDIGIDNVTYTGCPTMWDLTDEHIAGVPEHKAEDVVFSLTAYLRKPEIDAAFVNMLIKRYRKVYFWPQMYDDLDYLNSISKASFEILEPTVAGVKAAFTNTPVDYVGLRLHCGVFALQNKVRSLILEVDNRATEIGKNTNLPTCARDNFAFIDKWIDGSERPKLDIPHADIARWKSQFVLKPAKA
jgi:polysaccharide pyruvyl transferase WcaK-like protein